MSQNVLFNGQVYVIPDTSEQDWGANLTAFFVAIPQGALQKTGGVFTLTADANFGANFGLLAQYFKSRSSNLSTAGIVRLAVGDSIGWRNTANGGNLLLAVNGSDQLTFNGVALGAAGNYITALTGDVTATGPGSVAATIAANAVTGSKFRQSVALSLVGNATNATANVADIVAGTDHFVLVRNGTALAFALLVNANIDPAAAIAYSKLNLTGSILNADLAGSIAYSKLVLTGAILNADLAGSIAYSKLVLTGAILNADLAGSIAYSKLVLTGAILNADLAGSITASKLVGSDIATVGTVTSGTWSASTIALNKGGTGQTTKTAAFDALSPMTTSGDIIYGGASGTGTRLAVGSANQVLQTINGVPSWQTVNLSGINYINANPSAEVDTAGWATYADSAANIPVDGTGGTATNLTFSRSTSSPLIGVASFSMVQANSTSLQGKGVSYDFTIDSAYKASALSIQFNYNASSTFVASNGTTAPLNDGTTTTNAGNSDIEVFVYDVTNSILIPVSPQVIAANGTNNFVFKGIFQTASNSTSYRLIFHIATTSANATGWTFKFDNVSVGPQAVIQGPPITDWASYALTIGAVTTPPTKGTASVDLAMWRRVGDSMEIRWNYIQTGAGTAGTGVYTLSIPSGYSIDTTKMPVSTVNDQSVVGSCTIDSGGGASEAGVVTARTASLLGFANATGAANTITSVSSTSFALSNANVNFSLFAKFPISGWSSTVQMSNDTSASVVAASYSSTDTPALTSSIAIVKFNTLKIDKTSSYSTSTGLFTVPVAGVYKVSAVLATVSVTNSTSQFINMQLYKNAAFYSDLGFAPGVGTSLNYRVSGSGLVECVAGDTLALWASNSVSTTLYGTTGFSHLDIQRLSGPSAIATTDTVAMRYTSANSPTVDNTRPTITFTTKDYDTTSSYSGGLFTAPISGKYRLSCGVVLTSVSLTTSQDVEIQIKKNGSITTELDRIYGNGTSQAYGVGGSDVFNLVAGDTLAVTVFASASSTLQNSSTYNHLTIERIGN